MNKEQQELLDEVFLNYWKKVSVNNEEDCLVKQEEGSFLKEVRALYQQEFINKCKTDTEFSQRWGLKIKERELSLEEREKIAITKYPQLNETPHGALINSRPFSNEFVDSLNIPTKLITITYKKTIIESYES
jgi:hypothetical protein